MAPQKFASVRYRSSPAALMPFRDDTGLVGLPYEQTKQAKPPIPIPPRNPLRSSPSPTTTTPPPRPMSTPPATNTLILSPATTSVLPPPPEEHPAFRNAFPSRQSAFEQWKRDSGLAPTASSGTIYEEDLEDVLYHKDVEVADNSSPVPPSVVPSVVAPADIVEDATSVYSTEVPDIGTQLQQQLQQDAQPETPETRVRCVTPPATTVTIQSPPSSPDAVGPVLSPSRSKRLGKTFSFRSRSSGPLNRLRKKSLSEDSATGGGAAAIAMLPLSRGAGKQPQRAASANQSPVLDQLDFEPLAISIPTESLLEDDFMSSVSFSKRGSIMFGGKRAMAGENVMDDRLDDGTDVADMPTSSQAPTATTGTRTTLTESQDKQSSSASSTTTDDANESPDAEQPTGLLSPPDIMVFSTDLEKESRKVRSFYAVGDAIDWERGGGSAYSPAGHALQQPTPEDTVAARTEHDPPSEQRLTPARATPRSAGSLSRRPDSVIRREHELAGGVEDWEDVDGADVDRYGFIQPKRLGTPTEMKSAQPSPRRNVLVKSDPANPANPSSASGSRTPNRKVSARSLNTQASEMSAASKHSSKSALRQAGNLLPHNRDRRLMDEAGDMLTMSPGLADIAEDEQAGKIFEALKRKEWERSEKWRKMAKITKKGKDGEGMEFDFDVKNPKLVDRTWKGIPDMWRAAAWYSFLASSAKLKKDSPTEEELIAEFGRLQDVGSQDDVQIDLDVPRTINRHIMFRRRYRGGQRLLFRVLHAIALYFPAVGYVQGMASLAATLLCYFDEEKCFVMLVRMWQLRGLERLYGHGFEGLMACLEDFEKRWMGGKDVADKLRELGIDATAYGTRWYLTLFNLSIPFPAQLRVWDVFLLLDDAPPESASTSAAADGGSKSNNGDTACLDVVHAASAALIHALRDVLLYSDFENAMKALTSWIPIKDEELLMKVTRAEWKQHHRKKT